MVREDELSGYILDHCFKIHRQYGPGLFERVYEGILMYDLKKAGFQVCNQVAIPIYHEELSIPVAYRADLIVENSILIELKSVSELPPLYYKQVLTYLRLADLKLGLLINFNVGLLKDGIHRVVNNL